MILQNKVYDYALQVLNEEITIDEVPIRFRNLVTNLMQDMDNILDYARNKKWEEIKAARDNAETAGLPFNGSVLDYDMRSAFKLEIAKQAGEVVGDTFVINWTMQDNTVQQLTLADLQNIPILASQYSNNLHVKAREYRELIYSKTDIKEILAIKWE